MYRSKRKALNPTAALADDAVASCMRVSKGNKCGTSKPSLFKFVMDILCKNVELHFSHI